MMEEQMLKRTGLETGKRMNKRDVVIVTVMTLIYLFIALINLGSFEDKPAGSRISKKLVDFEEVESTKSSSLEGWVMPGAV